MIVRVTVTNCSLSDLSAMTNTATMAIVNIVAVTTLCSDGILEWVVILLTL